MNKTLFYIIPIICILLASCELSTTRSHESGVWDDTTSTFYIEDETIYYTLPTDKSYWAIADKESLPLNMLFFGIEKNDGICIGIFRPDLHLTESKKSRDFSEKEIDVILRQMIKSVPSQDVICKEIIKKKDRFGGQDAWSFSIEQQVISKEVSFDTIPIFYSGYIFDGLEHSYGFVLISDCNPIDSIGTVQKKRYLETLDIGC